MARDLKEFIIKNYQKAIDYHYIQPYYQPVIRTISRQLCSFEALARWIDPVIGMIYPDEFIPVLEEIRAIHLLDACVIRQACARIRLSLDKGEIPVPVSVNLSRLDFELCDIFTVVDEIVKEFILPHDFIYIEITESVMAEKKDLMLEIVEQFHKAGYQIWMDDFGSAYSSLNILKEFTFNELKLDMCFLRPWTMRSRRIATSVIEMAKAIDIHTLAEGVETEEQFRYFRDIGCEKVQGYYFGKPMPYDAAMEHLRSRGIRVEVPQERKYYDDIGQVNVLSAVPFMIREERDSLRTALQLNSIPLAMLEFRTDCFHILFCNTAFETIARGTGMFSVQFSEEVIGQDLPYHLISDKVMNLVDSTQGGEEGRMHFTSKEDYYEITAKCFAKAAGKFTVLLRMSNLTKEIRASSTNTLDELLRQIYTIYERITLVNLKEDTITPLYFGTREKLVSGNKGIRKLSEEYAEKYIFPDDRKEYLRLSDPSTMRERFDAAGINYMMRFLRSNVRHGQYAWKAYSLLRTDEDRFFLMFGNVHDAMKSVEKINQNVQGYDYSTFTPELLWRDLVSSDLLRLFWKDRDRRFLGASRAFLDYYGFSSAADIVGKNDEELGWHVHPDTYMNDEVMVIHEGITTHNVPGNCMNDGENRDILASKTPLYDENGEIGGLIGYFIDRDKLSANDRRGNETKRRDMLTGLLNSRGISEEAAVFRDEYYLRGVDFVRIHISVDDFDSLNEQYGYDFGDKVLIELSRALKMTYGRTSAVGRYAGNKFVILHQVRDREQAHAMRSKIRMISESVHQVSGIPVTLYLSVGYVVFSEYLDLDEQAKKAEVRVLADYENKFSTETQMSRSSEIFHMFDNLPILYSVFHMTHYKETDTFNAVLFYANRKYISLSGRTAEELIGKSAHEIFPTMKDDWYRNLWKASQTDEVVEGEIFYEPTGKYYLYTATQIIYPGYCAVTYLEKTQTLS